MVVCTAKCGGVHYQAWCGEHVHGMRWAVLREGMVVRHAFVLGGYGTTPCDGTEGGYGATRGVAPPTDEAQAQRAHVSLSLPTSLPPSLPPSSSHPFLLPSLPFLLPSLSLSPPPTFPVSDVCGLCVLLDWKVTESNGA
eukprot:2947306-Rhodomonas_salina.1